MKLQRISDKKIFEAIGIPADRNRAAIPVALLEAVQPIDADSASVFVFNDSGRLVADAGDCIVFDGATVIAVLKAGSEQTGWRPVAETQPK
jgi:hypothetical protein